MAQIKFADLGSIQQLVKEILDRFPLKGHTHTKSEITDYVVDNSIDENSENPVQNKVVHAALEERVPIGRTVNGKSLDTDVTLTASDVGADEVGTAEKKAQLALDEAKEYAESVGNTVKNDLLNGAGEAYDTLKELGDLINDNQDAIGALETVATNKADKEHDHTVADITDYVSPVQSDWNQNDETALDFVKNRPFYGVLEEVTLLEETTIEPDESGYVEVYLPLIPLEENKAYTVVFDGESYECVAVYDSEYDEYFIENELFWVVSCPSYDETYIGCDGDGTHTISVSTMTGEVTKLDKMYLPNSVFAKPNWDENNMSADGFIKNRPFGRYIEFGTVLENFTFEGTEYEGEYTSTVLNRFVEGQSYDVYFDGILYEGVVYDDGLYYEDDDVYFEIYSEYWTDLDYVVDRISMSTNVEGSHSISIEGPVYYYVQLDEAYLPASITADWNETNDNKRSYIKNKPFSALKVDEVLFEGEITPNDINVDSEINITFDNAVEYNLNLSGASSDVLDNLMSNQLTYTVVLNDVEYRNLVPTFFYNTGFNRESFAGGIGASMTLSDDDGVVAVNFTEEYPFSIKLNDLDGMYHLLLPREFEGEVSYLKISVFGNVVDKLPDMYQHQADWNELVDTKASFIANKPFGEYLDYKLVPMYEGVSIIEDAGLREDGSSSGQFIDYPYETEDPNYNPVELNKKYTVIINNVRYDNLECFEVYNGENTSGIPTVGSPRYMLGTSATEYPFTIDAAGFGGIWLYIDTNKLPITEDSKFYLYEYVAETKVKTLDVKYLPEQFQFGKVMEEQFVTVLEEDFTPSSGSYGFQPGKGVLEEGELYRINLDGEVFEEIALGDTQVIGVRAGENAVVIYDSEHGQMAFSGNPAIYADGTQHHIVVEKLAEVEVFKTIDKKYLPEYLQFGETETVIDIANETPLFVGGTYNFDNRFGSYNCRLESPLNPLDFNNLELFYRVVWDGVEYICKPFVAPQKPGWEDVVNVGSPYLEVVDGTSELPFHIYQYQVDVLWVNAADDSATHTIDIYACEGTYVQGGFKTLETKYLPEHLQFGETEAIVNITNESEFLSEGEYSFMSWGENSPLYGGGDMGLTVSGSYFSSEYIYRVVWDGVEYYCTVINDEGYDRIGSPISEIQDGTSEMPFNIYFVQNDYIRMFTNDSSASHVVKIDQVEGEIIQQGGLKKIDPKYLPEMDVDMSEAVNESKAYTDEVATNKADKEHDHTVVDIADYVAPVQSDWNVEDETALDFIKNKPNTTDEEFMDMLMSIDALNVVADADNSIITDESDNVLIW